METINIIAHTNDASQIEATLLRPIGGQYAPAQGASPAGSFWGVGSDGGPTGDWTNWRRTAPSVSGQWLCLEWHLNAIDATHARGQRALKVSTTGNGRGRLTVSGLSPSNNSLHGVAHAWVTAFPTAPDYAHYTMVEFAGTGDGTLLRPIGGQYAPAQGASPAGSFWGVGSDGGPTGDWTNWRRTAPSVSGQWLCLEWHLNAIDASVDIWIDGVAKPELSVTRTMHGGAQVDLVFPAIDRAWFGWWLYQASPTPSTFEVWLDDLALASARLGCE